MNLWVYTVDKSGRLYVGITTDLDNRLKQHGNPALFHKEGPFPRDEAVKREKQLKSWSRKKKQELFAKGPEKHM